MTSTLPQRLRTAADSLEELGALFGYPTPKWVAWSPDSLRHEAAALEQEQPA